MQDDTWECDRCGETCEDGRLDVDNEFADYIYWLCEPCAQEEEEAANVAALVAKLEAAARAGAIVSLESAEYWGMGACLACGVSYFHCALNHFAMDLPDPGRCCPGCAHEDTEKGGIWRGNEGPDDEAAGS